MNEVLSGFLRVVGAVGALVGFVALVCSLYFCLEWWRLTRLVTEANLQLHELSQDEGDNGGNEPAQPEQRAGQVGNDGNGPAQPEQRAARDGNGGGPDKVEDDPQQEADLGDGQGGGGDQQEDDGGHHQHLSLVFPGNDGNHEAPRTAKVNPIQDGTLPSMNELKETTPVLQEYALSGKLNAKSLLKLLARKQPCEEQNASSEPLLNAAG